MNKISKVARRSGAGVALVIAAIGCDANTSDEANRTKLRQGEPDGGASQLVSDAGVPGTNTEEGTTDGGSTSSPSGFPTRATTGVPAGWTPKNSVTGDYWIRDDGAVVEDLRITKGVIRIAARNVTLRRIEFVGSRLDNEPNNECGEGLLIEQSSFVRSGPDEDWDHLLGTGGFTARRIKIDDMPEGIRIGSKDLGCGAVTVEDSFVNVTSPPECTNNEDWHGDGIQGYGGVALKVRNTTLEMIERPDCGGTAPFFYPANQGNTSVDIDGLIVKGGGYSFRLGTPGTVKGLKIVDKSWGYGPIEVVCSAVSSWEAKIVTLDANGQPVTVRDQPCNTEN